MSKTESILHVGYKYIWTFLYKILNFCQMNNMSTNLYFQIYPALKSHHSKYKNYQKLSDYYLIPKYIILQNMHWVSFLSFNISQKIK